MPEIIININGKEFVGKDGQTIVEAAAENGIHIPTLCHDERVKMYGSCGVCVVEAENSPRLIRACSTLIANGMVIKTDTPRVFATRQTALELLLSNHTGDCRPPCVLECPAHTDCQGYVGLIANGNHSEALKTMKDRIPLPASIGRVCPHPCETACRRKMVEEPVSIAALKSFAADKDLALESPYLPECAGSTGKTVAVIGGGPGGLSAAWFLRIMGHEVTVFDAMPKMGGMLQYGIPEYRLPKKVLDREIEIISKIGVKLVNNVKIGADITLGHIKKQFGAVLVAIGAWKNMQMGISGEDLPGVLSGIEFLRSVSLDNPIYLGKRVAVVGGGNTAMDCCRTAVRLGADTVYNIYRRTKNEMPAEEIEIQEAEEEGVTFKYLTNPVEIVGENRRLSHIRLQKMELGQPDASGRRAPVPTGEEETLELDTVIMAIGQGTNPEGFARIGLTRKNTITANESTFATSEEGVFAIGDAVNKGAGIAISAIGHAKTAAAAINAYLSGEPMEFGDYEYLVKTTPVKEDFADRHPVARAKMPHLSPEARKDNFFEVNHGYGGEQAENEAKRCLECGCMDYFECKLIKFANDYDVKPQKYISETAKKPSDIAKPDNSHPFIKRNPDKCILCGLCVRICDEVMGRSAFGLVGRGFDTTVQPEFNLPLNKAGCISCGQCVDACPTGALIEILPLDKQVPVPECSTDTVCSFCSTGCRQTLRTRGDSLIRALPAHDGGDALLCVKGRFGFSQAQAMSRLKTPLVRKMGILSETGFDEAVLAVNKKIQAVFAKHGEGSLAVTVSDRMTNEEIALVKAYAANRLKTKNVYSFGKVKSGIAEVLGSGKPTVTFESLKTAECILLFETDIMRTHTIAGIKIKKAVEGGARLVAFRPFEGQSDEWAEFKFDIVGMNILKQFTKAMLELRPTKLDGAAELAESLASVEVPEEVKKAAALYANAKTSVIVFDEQNFTIDAARLIGDIAALKGITPRNGVISMKPGANSGGLGDDVLDGSSLAEAINSGTVKGLVVFGEDIRLDFDKLEFLAVMDVTMTVTAAKADVLLPAAALAESDGTVTNSEGRVGRVNAAVKPPSGKTNIDILKKLCAGEEDARAKEKQTCGVRLMSPQSDAAISGNEYTNIIYNRFMETVAKNNL